MAPPVAEDVSERAERAAQGIRESVADLYLEIERCTTVRQAYHLRRMVAELYSLVDALEATAMRKIDAL